MKGLALEGGGAKGAYHIGVVKALYEEGHEFDGFVGTSIGAINAAILAGGDFDKALEVWGQISAEQIFDEDEQPILKLIDKKSLTIDSNLLSATRRKALRKILENRGINTERMKAFLLQYFDEEKIRASGKDFGLVTISISDRKPHELMKEDIPKGQLFSYIMASAALPVFRKELIDEKAFLDGGFYNNCPYNLLLDKGYDEVIIIRTNSYGIFRKTDDPRVKVISPRDSLGNSMLFSPESSGAQLKLGYYDGLRFCRGLLGRRYYVKPGNETKFIDKLVSLKDNVILNTGNTLRLQPTPAKRMLFERIIPILGSYLKLEKNFNYVDFVVALLEHAAAERAVERFSVYSYEQLCGLAKETEICKKEKKTLQTLSTTYLSPRKEKAIKLLSEQLL